MAHSGAKASADVEDIVPRDIRFEMVRNATRHWFGGDIVKTSIIDGLSIFLPDGERFFIRSLKHYASKVDDAELAAEINGYAVQEAFHTREHAEYNRAMASLGYDVEAMEKPVGFALAQAKTALHRLAITCAIEHLTASFSTCVLRRPELLAEAAPPYRRLWMWHALEELEHKAVALDVFETATHGWSGWKRYLLRTAAMNATVIPFLLIFLRNVGVYVRADGVKPGVTFWSRFVWALFGKPGFWRYSVGPFLRYYLPRFDPRNADDAELVQRGRDWLAREMPDAGPSAPYGAVPSAAG